MPAGYDAFIQEANVTLDTTANRSLARDGANPALTAALVIAGIAAATLAGAWFFQLVLDIKPCPLCLEQRYAYYLAIPLGALVAFAAAKDAPRGVLVAGVGLGAPRAPRTARRAGGGARLAGARSARQCRIGRLSRRRRMEVLARADRLHRHHRRSRQGRQPAAASRNRKRGQLHTGGTGICRL